MKISLIGMSGSGKSFWAQKLEEAGFVRFSIDELIGQELTKTLPDHDFSTISNVAEWLGFPDEVSYADNSARYLALEEKTLKTVLSALRGRPNSQDIVIDTTGSVIYLDQRLLDVLTGTTRVVYLDIPKSVQKLLYKQYLDEPKPVIWGDRFSQTAGEATMDALRRCYPELLAFRTKAYQALADDTLPYEARHSQTFTTNKLIEYLRTL